MGILEKTTGITSLQQQHFFITFKSLEQSLIKSKTCCNRTQRVPEDNLWKIKSLQKMIRKTPRAFLTRGIGA